MQKFAPKRWHLKASWKHVACVTEELNFPNVHNGHYRSWLVALLGSGFIGRWCLNPSFQKLTGKKWAWFRGRRRWWHELYRKTTTMHCRGGWDEGLQYRLLMSVARRKQQLRWNWNKNVATEDQSDGNEMRMGKEEILGISLLQDWLWGGCKSE